MERVADVRTFVDEAISEARDKAEGRPLAVRIELTLRPGLYSDISKKPEEFRMDLAGFASRDVWIEKIRLKQAVVKNAPALVLNEDAKSELLTALQVLRNNADADPLTAEDCGKLKKTLPSEVREVFTDKVDEIWERATALLQAAAGEGA
ncbi:MAG TPA: hypothetical protein VHR66_20135 [Gemmataceae bacterium]|nr:hypothetical protein [Gemmataceae bacterium]